MRVLVTGGRDYANMPRVFEWLDKIAPTTVMHGGCPRGADAFAHRWCLAHKDVQELIFPADWTEHGLAAGPIRNQRMIDYGKPEMVLKFQGGRGTADCVRRAKKAGLRIQEVT